MTVKPDQMLVIARELETRDGRHPGQPSLTRAVSTAYYALFRVMLHEVVGQTITWGFRSDRYWDTVRPLYRSVDHGHAKAVFNRALNDPRTSTEMRQLARIFIDIQAERIRADYDPRPDFKRSEAVELIEQAGRAMALLRSLPSEAKRLLVVHLIAKQR